MPPPDDFRLVDAFNEALSHTNRGKQARYDWQVSVKRFMTWLAKEFPDCLYWRLLTRQVVRRYLDSFEGLSANHKRLSLQPICQTSGYMHREYGYVNFAERLGIGSKMKTTPKIVYGQDVLELLAFMREKHPRLLAGAALQGFAGLQLQEATRLTWDKVDLERGLIEISGEVKNEYRNRVIPVSGPVLEALREAYERRAQGKIQDVKEYVLLSKQGCPYIGASWQNYSQEMRVIIRQWNSRTDWTPKDLRNMLSTFATLKGIHGDVWEQYMGHAPRSITARHYVPRLASATTGEKNALEVHMAVFRFHVVEPLNEAVRTGFKHAFLKFFEPAPTKQVEPGEAAVV
ncbi:tyrosine-type recombinase/integrase [bacterium]|nr:tyrosine-type recombinase/integrase [bacterium]